MWWLQCYVDLVDVSRTRCGWRDAVGVLASVEQGRRDEYARTCRAHGFEELLSRICQLYNPHIWMPPWEAHSWVFRYLSSAVIRNKVKRFVRRQLPTLGWWFRLVLNLSSNQLFIILYEFAWKITRMNHLYGFDYVFTHHLFLDATIDTWRHGSLSPNLCFFSIKGWLLSYYILTVRYVENQHSQAQFTSDSYSS